MRSLQKHGEGKGFDVAYLKARIFIAIWYQPMNWLAIIILPLQVKSHVRSSGQRRIYMRSETYIHEVGDVYTWGLRRIYIKAETNGMLLFFFVY